MTGKVYRVESRRDLPLVSHADFSMPMAVFTLIPISGGETVHISLSRRTSWQPGETVQVDDATVKANLIR